MTRIEVPAVEDSHRIGSLRRELLEGIDEAMRIVELRFAWVSIISTSRHPTAATPTFNSGLDILGFYSLEQFMQTGTLIILLPKPNRSFTSYDVYLAQAERETI